MAVPTPETVVSAGTMTSSARRDNRPGSSVALLTASDITGVSVGLRRMTTGASASSGRSGTTAAILSRTSWAASALFVPSLNLTTTRALPALDVELSFSIPDRVFSSSSTGLVTSLSTASDEAPG